MLLAEFDALPDADAQALLRSCAAVPWWAEQVAAGRPYGSLARLRTHADELARRWSPQDVRAALADHPRIGERHAGSGTSAALSAREQAGVDPTDADVARRLADGNARYEARFGQVYLVRAAGRTAAEMLALLEQRLGHDDATEAEVTARELREIAALRLAALVTVPAAAGEPLPVTPGPTT